MSTDFQGYLNGNSRADTCKVPLFSRNKKTACPLPPMGFFFSESPSAKEIPVPSVCVLVPTKCKHKTCACLCCYAIFPWIIITMCLNISSLSHNMSSCYFFYSFRILVFTHQTLMENESEWERNFPLNIQDYVFVEKQHKRKKPRFSLSMNGVEWIVFDIWEKKQNITETIKCSNHKTYILNC